MICFIFLFSQVEESFQFSIALAWKDSAPEAEDGTLEQRQTKVVFPRGNTLPSTKVFTFLRSGTFTVDILYEDVNQVRAPALISSYMVWYFMPKNKMLPFSYKILRIEISEKYCGVVMQH